MRLLPLPKKTTNLLKKNSHEWRKKIEEKGEVKLKISGENAVIEGDGGNEWIVEQVLTALSYGFAPKEAFKLFKDNYFIEVVDLEQAFRRHEKKIKRYKARVIGSGGRSKKKLQELTGAHIAVSEKQIAVLGEFEEAKAAKEAVLRLLEGAEHSGVYAFLEKQKQKNRWL